MRKFLSLVLALVMTMSLVTISAGAKDFADNDVIDYDEAVAVISALGVVDGYADGTFGPNGNLTRQAAAKIICNLILGPTTAKALKADAAPFPDVPADGEFAGYIAYCASRGIIGGYADGTFQPGGSLTGNAFMKMLLGALGYDGSIEGFGGANWTINVGKLAMGLGLEDGLLDGFDGYKTVTRQEAALYALNTLEATMVDYGQKIVITDANGNPQVVGHQDATNVGQGQYPSYDGAAVNQQGFGTGGTLQFCERYFSDLRKNPTTDNFGRPSHIWKIKTSEIGTWTNDTDLVASWTDAVSKDTMFNTLGQNVIDNLKDNVADANENAKLSYFVDGWNVIPDASSKTDTVIDEFASRRDTGNIGKGYTGLTGINASVSASGIGSGNGALTEVYLNKDTGAVDIVTIHTYVFQATADYSSSRDEVRITAVGNTDDVRLANLSTTTLDGKDFDIADVKEDDYLLLTLSHDGATDNYEIETVEPAEIVTGEVTALDGTSKVTLDGTVYNYSFTALAESDEDTVTTPWNETTIDGVRSLLTDTGTQAALVLDKYGNIIAIDDSVIGGNYVFIESAAYAIAGLTGSNVLGHAYFTDGTVEDIVIKKVGTGPNSTVKSFIKDNSFGWYTYTKDSNNRYSLNTITNNTYDTDATDSFTVTSADILTSGNSTLPANGIGSKNATNRTVFIVVDKDGEVSTFTGIANAPTVKATSGENATIGYVWQTNGNYATYVFISVEGADGADVDRSDETDQFVFLLGSGKRQASGTSSYYRYDAIVDGALETVYADSQYKWDGINEGNALWTKVRKDAETDRITSMKSFGSEETNSGKYIAIPLYGADIEYKNDIVSVDGEGFLLANNYNLNVIVNKGVTDILVDDDADREVHTSIKGGSLNGIIGDNLVNGTLFVSLKDKYSDKATKGLTAKAMYLFISGTETDVGTALQNQANTLKTQIQTIPAEDLVLPVQETEYDGLAAAKDDIIALIASKTGATADQLDVTQVSFTPAANGAVGGDGTITTAPQDGEAVVTVTITVTRGVIEKTATTTNITIALAAKPITEQQRATGGAKAVEGLQTSTAAPGGAMSISSADETVFKGSDATAKKNAAEALIEAELNGENGPGRVAEPQYWATINGTVTWEDATKKLTCTNVVISWGLVKGADENTKSEPIASVAITTEVTLSPDETKLATVKTALEALDDSPVAGADPAAEVAAVQGTLATAINNKVAETAGVSADIAWATAAADAKKAVNGATNGDNGTNGKVVATVTLTAGEATDEVTLTYTISALAYSATNAGKVAAAKTAYGDGTDTATKGADEAATKKAAEDKVKAAAEAALSSASITDVTVSCSGTAVTDNTQASITVTVTVTYTAGTGDATATETATVVVTLS